MKETIFKIVSESIAVKERFFNENADKVVEAASTIAEAFSKGKKLLLFGNGGSSSDASHIAAEFINRFKRERPGLPAIALNTDMAVMTSIANDYDFSDVFARQVKSIADTGDVVIAISTSGGSKNVLKAVDAAKKKKLTVIAFTGAKGIKFAEKSTIAFVVPTEDTARIQETHITIGHVICELVESLLFEFPAKKTKKTAAVAQP
ncbi:D-sedoheptulose-7-phosphate isomerase [Candidatus Magnetominusculus xianensis]|uniref:Phosphoheptose isomerase n=1 Tax=Candidatus Magnetominusculus xianensis TaxID=1748249 RepID=A0ABR5SG80_9BACT|nr:SIS domain-containing protein [Candidatus Magnetominusculus xianensis]KWT88347.1 phosphoheptose isomerase [Candidatus Magnetominusculus xianensis]MBF0405448.1 SIS domain-containing protein [Nitrospirota bacterium]